MEIINLDMVPGKKSPVCHASQFDEGRVIRFNLYDSGLPFTLDGTESITFEVRKPDGNIVTSTLTNTSDSYVDVVTTEQMTAVKGANLCEVRIEKGETNIGSLNVIMAVEMDPTDGGIESASEIDNLRSQVNEMVAEEVAEQYDSANVIFDAEPTEGHGTGYTVTSEGIKTAIDNAFDYDNTASGSIVHIEDGADNIPVKSLVSEIVAVETGNGQPKSPDNPYIISGFDSGVITRCGKNLANFTDGYGISTSGEIVVNVKRTATVNPIKVDNTKNYVFTFTGSNIVGAYAVWNNNTLVRRIIGFGGGVIDVSGGNLVYLSCYNSTESSSTPPTTKADCKPQLEQNTTATTFEAYNGNTYTFNFGQTVYDGHFDNKGNLVVTKTGHIFDGSESFISLESGTVFAYDFGANMLVNSQVAQGKSLSTHFIEVDSGFGWNSVTSGKFLVAGNRYFGCNPNMSLADYKTFLTNQYQANTPVKAICLLANPITLSITSQDIPTLLGENNIYSITGDLEVNYYTSKSNDILEFINSEIGKKNGDNIPIEANSQDSIKTYVDNEISSTKDYIDNGLNDKVAYKSGEVVYSNYIAGAYVSGSGNYVEFCIPINTKASSGTITNLGTTLNVFIGNTRLTNEVSLADSSIVAIKDGYAQVELKLNSAQTANSVATVSLDGFTVNFA